MRVKKKLDFEFGKEQYAVYPVKLSRFAEQNLSLSKYQNFIRGALKKRVKRLSTN